MPRANSGQKRQKRDFDLLFAKAVEDGLTLDKSDVTPHFVYRIISLKSQEQYKKSLKLWYSYVKQFPRATPQDMQTLKHFAEFVAHTMKGRVKVNNPKQRAIVHSVRN
ncbi:hypothetical protein QQS21_001929 [Conoideocrella luteorostrata]|uniref:Uncharacterized protein n=1 Tax=Conoideocrella luteorostrata TaxID=1105319 RepID=A0AAJ0CZ07_9HYPO|nr:hypothetical protein QQS21_001929 [Conoideocrella luteorostrata]